MENLLLSILLLLVAGIALVYFVYKNESQTEAKGFVRLVVEEFLRIVATVFFGMFGFSWDQFIKRVDESNYAAKK